MRPIPFSRELLDIKEKVEQRVSARFNSCLLNHYRNGQDSNGWHSDDERELGTNPVIASVSLGAERMFHFRHKGDKTLRHKMVLQHGSLLLMGGETQHYWHHQLPKTKKKIGSRINMTFRCIL
ncbi:MAG: alpha-ketoglutarate-dependent dioxygenase AlkB [Flavobacteriaceae bacterium]